MSEPDYVERYQLDELTTRVELLEALHAGGLAVAEQHAAMVRELRNLSSYLGSKGCRESLLRGDWKNSKKEIDELLAWVHGDAPPPSPLELLRLAGVSEDVVTFLRDWHAASGSPDAARLAEHVCEALARSPGVAVLLETQVAAPGTTP